MKMSHYFLKTSKDAAQDEKIISARYLKQGGFIKESVAGRYYFLPIGFRVQQKIINIIREEMDLAGCQEMITPILHPLELWKETNRTNTTGFELTTLEDRRGAQFALGGTAEEMFVDLVRGYNISYRDLPFHLYQFSPKFRDELRARGGLLRVREFIMKDGYSFHKDAQDFKIEYEKMKDLYTKIFNRLGLKTFVVESDNGYIGGEYCHEFVVEAEVGESRFFVNEAGTYAAHEDVAVFEKELKNTSEEMQELKEVPAQRGNTMEDGVKHHNLPLWQQLKTVVFVTEKNEFVLVAIRGDYDVNETKLKHVINAIDIRPATDDEIRTSLKSEPGFISPVKIKDNIDKNTKLIIVADDSLNTVKNMYGGSNKKNLDLMNINITRDFTGDITGDIALAKAGYISKQGGILSEKKGIEVGNIFQLGYHYTNLMKNAVFVDNDGIEKPFYMGCYGIGVGRTLATLVEKYNDDKGIIWPKNISPFQVHLVALDGVKEQADEIYQKLCAQGIEVLYDDREKTAGEKFADADLIGCTYRIVVSKRNGGKLEVKRRDEENAELMDFEVVLQKFVNKGL